MRATQDIVAILRLRPESEISTDSLLNNLKGIMAYQSILARSFTTYITFDAQIWWTWIGVEA
ncbi:MAG: hypothetical protein ABSG57_09455 [Candidatus Bathyarchaeia archaeon]